MSLRRVKVIRPVRHRDHRDRIGKYEDLIGFTASARTSVDLVCDLPVGPRRPVITNGVRAPTSNPRWTTGPDRIAATSSTSDGSLSVGSTDSRTELWRRADPLRSGNKRPGRRSATLARECSLDIAVMVTGAALTQRCATSPTHGCR